MRKTNILLSPLGLRTSPLRISTYQRTFFGHAPPEGDHFIFAANFYPIEGGTAGGASG